VVIPASKETDGGGIMDCKDDVCSREGWTVASEMRRYGLEILGISESRWAGSGRMRLLRGETICTGKE